MKWKFALILFSAAGLLAAEEKTFAEPVEIQPGKLKQEYGYVSAGLGPFPLPLPAFAAGYRAQSGHNGFDVSCQVQTVVAVTQLKANLLYLHYFKPEYCSEFYVGGGVGPSVIFGSDYWWHRRSTAFLLSPEFVFGKQYRNESSDLRFFQMQVSFPTISAFHKSWHVTEFPLVIFSYGIGF